MLWLLLLRCVCVCVCVNGGVGGAAWAAKERKFLASFCNWYTRAFVWSVGSVGRAVEMTGLE